MWLPSWVPFGDGARARSREKHLIRDADAQGMRRTTLLDAAERAWKRADPLFERWHDLDPNDPRAARLPPDHRTVDLLDEEIRERAGAADQRAGLM